MVDFTSRHERRLWAAALAVLVAIYAAAALSGTLLEAFGSDAVLGIAFAAGLGLAVVAVLGVALNRGPHIEVWVAIGIAAGWMMIPVRAGVAPLERTHLFEYGILGALLYAALSERAANRGRPRLPGLLAIVATAGLGWLDEAIQGLLPARVHDPRDVAVNALAGAVAVAVVATGRWIRRGWADRTGGTRPRRDVGDPG